MKKFDFFRKKKQPASAPLWSKQVHGKNLDYKGEDIDAFLLEFDRIEDEIISLWDLSKLSWENYQRAIAELQEAKQLFVRFAYH